jgi:hypothetical protein
LSEKAVLTLGSTLMGVIVGISMPLMTCRFPPYTILWFMNVYPFLHESICKLLRKNRFGLFTDILLECVPSVLPYAIHLVLLFDRAKIQGVVTIVPV